MNKLWSIFLACTIALGSSDVLAKRLGGGMSFGKQSGNVTQQRSTTPPTQQGTAQPAPTQNAAARPATSHKAGVATAAHAAGPANNVAPGPAATSHNSFDSGSAVDQSLADLLTPPPRTTATEGQAPHCPRCQAAMVRVRPKDGRATPFWSCSNYPQCRTTLTDTGESSVMARPTDSLGDLPPLRAER